MLSERELDFLVTIYFGSKERSFSYGHIGLFGSLLQKGFIEIASIRERIRSGLTAYFYTVSEKGRCRVEEEIHKSPERVATASETYLNWVPEDVPRVLRTPMNRLPEALVSDVPIIRDTAELLLRSKWTGKRVRK